MTTKYNGVVFQVKGEGDVYTISHVLDDKYNLVNESSGKVFSSYPESCIEEFIKDGDWIVLEGGSGGVQPDAVNSPKHYSVFENVEAIQVIASSMTQDQFYGYCLGNILKYRLRAGGKDDVMQELGKADKYQELYTQHKHLCRG